MNSSHLVIDAACLAGYSAEHYQVPLPEASRRWYAQMWTKLTALCAERVPGGASDEQTRSSAYARTAETSGK